MRVVRRLLLVLALLILGTGVYAAYVYNRQGLSPEEISNYCGPGDGSKIELDARGIPTIDSDNWFNAVSAEGYVVASDRMFQMDLMRRAAAGRLAEWFGPLAVEADRRRKLEDWEGVAQRAYKALPREQQLYIDQYTWGVNHFIETSPGRWGLEYALLMTEPEPWEGKDSILLMLSMDEQLTAFSGMEATGSRWQDDIGDAWFNFLFTLDHPWNDPMFGTKPRDRPELPLAKALAKRAIESVDRLAMQLDQKTPPPILPRGSNNWAWCGKTGCFLANDPHLGASVPHLWYAVRMRVDKDDWVAGVAIPGLPGVVLGMNPHLAWAFTNVGEDVDDLLLEQLSPDGEQYLASVENGEEVWKPVERREHVIHVKGGDDEKVFSRHTHRGPLVKRPVLGDQWYSRQWLPYVEGIIHLPVQYNRAKSFEEMNAALDDFRVPAQNVVMVDRAGNVGYRTSGTGVQRKISGRRPQRAIDGEWAGLEPASSRPRMLYYVKDSGEDHPRWIATANERIWVDEYGERWVDDLRKDRIRRVLSSRDDFTREDMETLQRDTESRYFHLILDWVRAHAEPAGAEEKEILDRWAKWNGVAADDPTTFTEAIAVEGALVRVCLDRVRRALMPEKDREIPYEHWMKSAWVITALEAEHGTEVFGFDERELAKALLEVAKARTTSDAKPYYEENRWAAQHPFVGRVPVIGDWFKVDAVPQYGWRGVVVRVEQPTFGASVRLVWDLSKPANSTWSLPVGQSGHIRSPHYKDLQAEWAAGKPFPVFSKGW